MGTGTLRFGIIVALVVGGVLLIDQAFPANEAVSLPRPSESVSPTGSPSAGGGQTDQTDEDGTGQTGGGQQPQAPRTKVVVGVYNGTYVSGLAQSTADQLMNRPNYRVPQNAISDAPDKPLEQTTIYYRTPQDREAAEELRTGFFENRDVSGVVIQSMPTDLDVPDSLDLAIYLGTDSA